MSFASWAIPRHVVDETAHAFASGRHEVFVLWTAALCAPSAVCVITRAILPAQQPGATTDGVYVHIDGRELSRIQFENYDRSERSVVQLHTHPTMNVTMSGLDRQWEVVKYPGALSIIVPCYGDHGLQGFPGVNVYEREITDWRLWTPEEVSRRLQVIDE